MWPTVSQTHCCRQSSHFHGVAACCFSAPDPRFVGFRPELLDNGEIPYKVVGTLKVIGSVQLKTHILPRKTYAEPVQRDRQSQFLATMSMCVAVLHRGS
jgi:hypothetical protein